MARRKSTGVRSDDDDHDLGESEPLMGSYNNVGAEQLQLAVSHAQRRRSRHLWAFHAFLGFVLAVTYGSGPENERADQDASRIVMRVVVMALGAALWCVGQNAFQPRGSNPAALSSPALPIHARAALRSPTRRWSARVADGTSRNFSTNIRLNMAWSVFALVLCAWMAAMALSESRRGTSVLQMVCS